MWPFFERRSHKRYPVNWDAAMHCTFPDRHEEIPVKVIDVSMSGAQLLLRQLQFGPYHLLADDFSKACELMIPMPEASVASGINILWYNWNDEERGFAVGVQFSGMTEESKRTLAEAIREIKVIKGES